MALRLLLPGVSSCRCVAVHYLGQSMPAQMTQIGTDVIIIVLLLVPLAFLIFAGTLLWKANLPVPAGNVGPPDPKTIANVLAQYVLIVLILAVPILSVWLILNLVTTTSPSSLTNLNGEATATALAAQGTATTRVQAATEIARTLAPSSTPTGATSTPNTTAVAAAATTGASAATTGASAATTAANAAAFGGTTGTPPMTMATGTIGTVSGTPTPVAVATATPLDGVLGSLDSSAEPYRRYLIAAFITLITSLIEIFLILIYGAYFINDPRNANEPLGLPPSAVRIFLIVVIVFVILVFTLLPDAWGSNKTTVLLIGLLTTVVGFYFGSKQGADAVIVTTIPTYTLRFDNTTIPPAGRAHVIAHVVEDITPLVRDGPPLITIFLLQNNGVPFADSTVTAALGRNDKAVEFDLANVPFPNVETSYIVEVLSPSSVECGDRLIFQI